MWREHRNNLLLGVVAMVLEEIRDRAWWRETERRDKLLERIEGGDVEALRTLQERQERDG